MNPASLLGPVLGLARQAGEAIVDVYRSDFVAREKADASPVTEADVRAEAIIVSGLARLAPSIPCVSEEAAASGRVPRVTREFWLVDPLDGTREFIGRNGEFTVNIALVRDGLPVLGVVLAPALGTAYLAAAGAGAWVETGGARRAIHATYKVPGSGLIVVASRSHGDDEALSRFLAGRPVSSTRGIGSSLKFCLVAEGQAHLYPRFGPTMEWDTAAGHAVLSAAGGFVTSLAGEPLRYGKAGFRNPSFIAGCPAFSAGEAPS